MCSSEAMWSSHVLIMIVRCYVRCEPLQRNIVDLNGLTSATCPNTTNYPTVTSSTISVKSQYSQLRPYFLIKSDLFRPVCPTLIESLNSSSVSP